MGDSKLVQELTDEPDRGLSSADDLAYLLMLQTGGFIAPTDAAKIRKVIEKQSKYLTESLAILEQDEELQIKMGGVTIENALRLAKDMMAKSKKRIEHLRDENRVDRVLAKVEGEAKLQKRLKPQQVWAGLAQGADEAAAEVAP